MFKCRYNTIEKSSTVDGPGIRYVLFLQGCPVKCIYCHNPETWNFNKGQEASVEDVLVDFKKNPFYKNVGFTVSGGEALCQLEFLIELFKELKKESIHTCVETSGCVYNELQKDRYVELLKYTDLVILDIKTINPSIFSTLSPLSKNGTFQFMELLAELNKKTIVHHVVVDGLTFNEDDLRNLGTYLKKFKNIEKIELLPYRTGGVYKYRDLGIEYGLEGVKDLEYKKLNQAKTWIEEVLID